MSPTGTSLGRSRPRIVCGWRALALDVGDDLPRMPGLHLHRYSAAGWDAGHAAGGADEADRDVYLCAAPELSRAMRTALREGGPAGAAAARGSLRHLRFHGPTEYRLGG